MSDFGDSIVLDVSQLRLKWAVEDVNHATQKLIDLLDKRGDTELIQATTEYIKKMTTYVEVAGDMGRLK